MEPPENPGRFTLAEPLELGVDFGDLRLAHLRLELAGLEAGEVPVAPLPGLSGLGV
jgi:hypothetical protein